MDRPGGHLDSCGECYVWMVLLTTCNLRMMIEEVTSLTLVAALPAPSP